MYIGKIGVLVNKSLSIFRKQFRQLSDSVSAAPTYIPDQSLLQS